MRGAVISGTLWGHTPVRGSAAVVMNQGGAVMSPHWWDDDDEERDDPFARRWDDPFRQDEDDEERLNPLKGMLGPGGMPLPLMWDIWHGNWPPDGGSEVQ